MKIIRRQKIETDGETQYVPKTLFELKDWRGVDFPDITCDEIADIIIRRWQVDPVGLYTALDDICRTLGYEVEFTLNQRIKKDANDFVIRTLDSALDC